MNLTIYTYGYIDAMYYALNGIAMIMNSEFAELMISGVSIIAASYYGLRSAYSFSSGSGKIHLMKIAGMIIVINSLLLPKTTIFLEDHITKERDKVDNLPYGFAVPIGFMELFGNAITSTFEQAFTPVMSSSYRDYGMVFGARLVKEARNFRINTPDFAENMHNFIKRCVIPDASIGNKYGINDLFGSGNVWTLVKEKASGLRRVEMITSVGKRSITCKEAAVDVLEPAFVNESGMLVEKYANTEFGSAGNISNIFTQRGSPSINQLFKKNLSIAFNRYLGGSNTAEDNIRQYMMLSSMSDVARSYGYAKSSIAQESNWQIAGDLASIYLPILLSVMKILVYTSFIFMMPLMLLGGGMVRYLGYIALIASLQLWPALNSILNMFIDLYSASEMHSIKGGVISFTSYSKAGDYADKIVGVASGLQMVVPFLAFSLMQGGVSGFIHLASNITSASNSASASAAQEVASGNLSFDNYSSGNMQMVNNQGFKTDWNTSYKTGMKESQRPDGGIERALQNGDIISMTGPGITDSSGANKIILNEEATNQLHDSYSENLEYRHSMEVQRAESQKTLEGLLNQYAEAANTHQSLGRRVGFEKLGSIESGVRNALSHARGVSSNKENSKRQSNSWEVGANIGFGGGMGGVGAHGGVSGGASYASDNSNTQSLSDHISDTTQRDWNEDKKVLLQASQNKDFNESIGVSKDLVSNISHTYEKMQMLDRSISHSMAVGNQLQKQISHSQYISSGYNNDITGDVRDHLLDHYKMSAHEADHLISNQATSSPSDRLKLNNAKKHVENSYSKHAESRVHGVIGAIRDKGTDIPAEAAQKIHDFYESERLPQETFNPTAEGFEENINSAQKAIQLEYYKVYAQNLKEVDDAKEKNAANVVERGSAR